MNQLKWTIGDIIDLEYFFKKDLSQTDQSYLKKRDRKIYLDCIEPVLKKDVHLKDIYHILPGDAENNFNSLKKKSETNSQKIGKILFLILGILAGISLCTSFFSYTGTNPLNVAYYISITVLPQIFLLSILLFSLFLTKQNIISKKSNDFILTLILIWTKFRSIHLWRAR